MSGDYVRQYLSKNTLVITHLMYVRNDVILKREVAIIATSLFDYIVGA